jgi:hypothetical protein
MLAHTVGNKNICFSLIAGPVADIDTVAFAPQKKWFCHWLILPAINLNLF